MQKTNKTGLDEHQTARVMCQCVQTTDLGELSDACTAASDKQLGPVSLMHVHPDQKGLNLRLAGRH